MKKILITLITILLVTSCIACTQESVEKDITMLTQSTKPFVEVELTPNVSDFSPTDDGVIMIYQ